MHINCLKFGLRGLLRSRLNTPSNTDCAQRCMAFTLSRSGNVLRKTCTAAGIRIGVMHGTLVPTQGHPVWQGDGQQQAAVPWQQQQLQQQQQSQQPVTSSPLLWQQAQPHNPAASLAHAQGTPAQTSTATGTKVNPPRSSCTLGRVLPRSFCTMGRVMRLR